MNQFRGTPKVSVGVPVYNGQRYLAETLDSLLAQTFTDFELIICDNASTDQTEQICSSYASRDSRIRYVRNDRNLGVARNYQRALTLSSGKYFRWAAGDDLSAPELLARCVYVLDQDSSVVLAYPRTRLIDERGSVISEYQDRAHLVSPNASERFAQIFQNMQLCNTIFGLIRSEVLKKVPPLGTYIASDIILMAELALHGKFWEVPEVLFYRRMHAQASSSNKDSLTWMREFYDPQDKKTISLIEWRHLAEKLRAIGRAPLSLSQKARLVAYVARSAVWNRRKLGGEVFQALSLLLRRAPHA